MRGAATRTHDYAERVDATTIRGYGDRLPARQPLGGTLIAVPGSSVITYTGGTIPAGGTCEVSVDVTSTTPGTHTNTTRNLTSSLGNSRTASAVLQVQAPRTGSITIVKEAFPADGTNFNFFSPEFGGFVLDDAAPDDNDGLNDTRTFTNLAPGTYTVLEQGTPAPGWALVSIACVTADVSDTSQFLVNGVQLDLDQSIVCTFTNRHIPDELPTADTQLAPSR